MSPEQRALWFLGLTNQQIKDKDKAPLSSIEDAIVMCDVIMNSVTKYYPPDLLTPYWQEVKQKLLKLKK